jgi:hypothetical protein
MEETMEIKRHNPNTVFDELAKKFTFRWAVVVTDAEKRAKFALYSDTLPQVSYFDQGYIEIRGTNSMCVIRDLGIIGIEIYQEDTPQ